MNNRYHGYACRSRRGNSDEFLGGVFFINKMGRILSKIKAQNRTLTSFLLLAKVASLQRENLNLFIAEFRLGSFFYFRQRVRPGPAISLRTNEYESRMKYTFERNYFDKTVSPNDDNETEMFQ